MNWLLRDVLGWIKEAKIAIQDCSVTPEKLGQLVKLLEDGTVNNKGARVIFEEIAQNGGEPMAIVEAKGLKQIGSVEELEAVVKKVIEDNQKIVEQYKGGNQNVFGFFVGACMKATQGKGNPKKCSKRF